MVDNGRRFIESLFQRQGEQFQQQLIATAEGFKQHVSAAAESFELVSPKNL